MSGTDIGTDRLDVRFGSTLEGVETICGQAKGLLLEHRLEEYLFEVLLLVREALVNAVEHGNEMNPEKCVKFHMKLSDRDVFNRMVDAEEKYRRWEHEYKRRGLDKKPYIQYGTLPKEVEEYDA